MANVAQIPRKGKLGPIIRSAFIPKEGYKMVGGDYSNFELRIIAELSKDPMWVNAFKEDKDLHSELCMKTFNISLDKIKDPFPQKPDITYRDVQKTINFGLAYGMSEFKLSNTINVSVNEARNIINTFFKAVPHVKQFLDTIKRFGRENGFIRTPRPYSRVRWFPRWKEIQQNPQHPSTFKWIGEIERKASNTPIQGANGDLIKQALINIQKYIDTNKLDVNILLSIYDEIWTECPEDFAEEWKPILEKLMADAARILLKNVPIKVDCEITDHWKK